jgi:hypothetical protein
VGLLAALVIRLVWAVAVPGPFLPRWLALCLLLVIALAAARIWLLLHMVTATGGP